MKKKLHQKKTKQRRKPVAQPKPKIDVKAEVARLRYGPRLLSGAALGLAAAAFLGPTEPEGG